MTNNKCSKKSINKAVTLPLVQASPTIWLSREATTSKRVVSSDVILTTNTTSYRIISDEYVGAGGESEVYRAEDLKDGTRVVAKIYTSSDYSIRAREARKKL